MARTSTRKRATKGRTLTRRPRRRILDRKDMRRRVADIFGESMHAARVASLADAVTGTLQAASLSVTAIGVGLAANNELTAKHAVKQVDRLLSNKKLDVSALFEPWLAYVLGNREDIVVAMDWTEFDRDDQSTLAISMITSHGRATPLVWKTVRKSELKGERNNHEDALVGTLLEALPPGVHVTLLADRGFGSQALYDFLITHGVDFVIRFRQDINVTDARGTMKPAKEWLTPSGRAKMLKGASVTTDQMPVPAVVVVHDKKMKDPWCLATTLGEESARNVVVLYGRRFKIEETFRDTKDPRFGYGLSQTRINSPERRDRLFFVCAIAHALLTLLGAAGERVGLDRELKVNTVKTRVHSLFRQGSMWYMFLPNMNAKKLRLLMSAYDEIVREHRVFREAFGIV